MKISQAVYRFAEATSQSPGLGLATSPTELGIPPFEDLTALYEKYMIFMQKNSTYIRKFEI